MFRTLLENRVLRETEQFATLLEERVTDVVQVRSVDQAMNTPVTEFDVSPSPTLSRNGVGMMMNGSFMTLRSSQ
jgi:hypothetical protein